MSTALRDFTSGKHIMIQSTSLRFERLEQLVRDWCEVMRFRMQRPVMAICFLTGFEPRLSMEALRLADVSKKDDLSRASPAATYLIYILHHLFPTPPYNIPVIIVLLRASNARCPVHSTTSAEERPRQTFTCRPSTPFIDSLVMFKSVSLPKFCRHPPTISLELEILAVWTSLHEPDLDTAVFREPAGNDIACRFATYYVVVRIVVCEATRCHLVTRKVRKEGSDSLKVEPRRRNGDAIPPNCI